MITWFKIDDVKPPEGVHILFAHQIFDYDAEYLTIAIGYSRLNARNWFIEIAEEQIVEVPVDNVRLWAPIPKFIKPNQYNIADFGELDD
jgi:hypothetical protein